LFGDFNARIGNAQFLDSHLFEGCGYVDNKRNSRDLIIDGKGRKILDLFENIGAVVLNGRHIGDKEGEFTFYRGAARSVIDYAACSFDLLNLISDFHIPEKEYSDHMPLVVSLSIAINGPAHTNHPSPCNKLKWRSGFQESYANNLVQATNFDYILEEDVVDKKVSVLVGKICKASPLVNKSKQFTAKKPWFDAQCEHARRKMLVNLNQMRKSNLDIFRREYALSRSRYLQLCLEKKEKHKFDTINLLSSVKNSADWWRIANTFKISSSMPLGNLNATDFLVHFSTLLKADENSVGVSWCLPAFTDSFLDAPFELREICMFLQKCKREKAPGPDGIPYEFYANAPISFILEVLRLLNYIFLNEDIPTAFRIAIIVPLYKKGDPNDANNYRGLSLLNTLCKIFTGLILNRITTWMDVNNILSEFQAGFRHNYSTVDQIFNLVSIVHINFSLKKKTYAFFVDLRFAFDKLPRNSLFYKLSSLGLSRKIIVIIMLLYNDSSSQVLYGNKLSEAFKVSQGVKQGCLLSPTLFALYLNDLHESLPGGVTIGDTKVKALLYADDIVLLSTCPKELQEMIVAFDLYCTKWGLSVNLEKSKVVVFREGPRIPSGLKFSFQNNPIEICNEYKYLGILLTYNMSFRKHLEVKLKTAINALNGSWSHLIQDPKIDISSKFKIFYAAAKSIVFYGAQVWGYIEYDEVERLLRFFLKKVLYLPSNTPNYMLNLETGICSMYTISLSYHFQFIRRVCQLPNSRLPRILAYEVFNRKIFWAAKWQSLFSEADLLTPETLFADNLKSLHERLIKIKCDTQYVNNLIKARFSTHDLYSGLNFDFGPTILHNLPIRQLSLIFKARGGLLCLNANPFVRRFSELCSVCNLQVAEDTFHFIGICPIYRNIRIHLLGKAELSSAEVIDLLNGLNATHLFEFLARALKYRSLILNEFN